MLVMEQVSYHYKKQKEKMIIKNKTLEFCPGVMYALYGDSGVGKTTCLSLLGGLEVPTKGRIVLDGIDIRKIGYNRLRRNYVTYIFQEFYLFPYMTAIENVMIAMRGKRSGENQKFCEKRAGELLDSLDIGREQRDRKVVALSGGEQQRVAIARALSTGASYILADEPTGNLDGKNTQIILKILRRLVREEEKCVIIVTHSEIVKEACDQCILLER